MFDFNRLVEAHITREHRPKQIGRYYPSEIGSCLRKVWYSYKYPRQVDMDLQKVFEVGNIVHGFVVEVLKSERNSEVELLKSEFPFKIEQDDYVISGRVDDLILLKEDGRQYLVEVKSTKDVSFVAEPQPSHEMQLMFYMRALNVHNGIILYIDKNNLQSKTFEITYSDRKGDEIAGRFSMLHENLKNDALPQPEAKQSARTSWMCRYCEYSGKCASDEK